MIREKQWKMAQVFGPLSATWKTWMELVAPDFGQAVDIITRVTWWKKDLSLFFFVTLSNILNK